MLALKELLHNLKDRDWDVNSTYSIDENEAKKLIEAIDETDKKIADYTYTIGLLQDRIEEIEKWIPVNKKLPEKYTYTLWCSLGGNVQSDYFNGEVWEDAEKYGYEVIAWMPLPQPYKAESEGKE